MTAIHSTQKIGEKMPDGTVYAGISPDMFKPLYAMPADEPLTMTFNQATESAQRANGHKAFGHDDWRVPTKDELNVLFNSRAAIGGFNGSGFDPSGWYRSSSCHSGSDAWVQGFSDGKQSNNPHDNFLSSVRLVR